MAVEVVRPSKKAARVGYTLILGLIAVFVLAYNNSPTLHRQTAWILALPALLLALPLSSHLRCRLTTLVVGDDKLHYRTGILTKTERSIRTSRIRNVLVEQTLFGRVLGTGRIVIETGEDTDLIVDGLDDPEHVAALILGAARKPSKKGKNG